MKKEVFHKIINSNNIILTIVIIFCVGVILDYIFFRDNCPQKESIKTTFESTIGKPELPVKSVNNISFFNGFVADVCNGIIMSPPFLCSETMDNITIIGWAINNDQNEELNSLYLEFNGEFIPVEYGLPRPDVQSFFGIPNSDKLGFSITLSHEFLLQHKNIHTIRFWGVSKDSTYMFSSTNYELIYPQPRPSLPYKTSKKLNLAINKISAGNIDNTTRTIVIGETSHIEINGWAVEDGKPLQDIFIVINNKVYATTSYTAKEEIKQLFNISSSDEIGFKIILPKQIFLDDDNSFSKEIEFIAITEDGIACEPLKYTLVTNF
ncbi:MAG: hypothetical protein IKY58_01960 [Paludibacteraceae bacterium]|nr:hypothetical protein [Paludibacteraceae bacterium]